MIMFNLCLRLSTFNDVLWCSLGRKHTYFNANEKATQTNMLVSWITTYHTKPDVQIMPASEQICPCLLYSWLFFFCLVCCLVCLCKENYSVPAVIPLILSDTGQFTAQTERVCWRRLRKKCFNSNKMRLMCNKFSTTTREIKHLYLAWKGVIGGKISLTGSMTHCSPQGNQCC